MSCGRMDIYLGKKRASEPLGTYEGKGYRVRYLGCDQSQIDYGGHDDPRDLLTEGEIYEVAYTIVHGFSTEVYLVGYADKDFNSVCFEDV